ncbi:hypothetical protein MPSEU_000352200 [Mayamaea pseudoterrestris]|nr:hypothetical protein MPSEU_000352200 [Mayamaea pseudoterrestris]
MSIRKVKTQQQLSKLFADDAYVHDNDDVNEGTKLRTVWGQTFKRIVFFTVACVSFAVIMVALKLIQPRHTDFMTASSKTSFTTTKLRKALTETQTQCTVWIAPSSLKGVNGYGTFTTRDLHEGERILPSHDGLGVPIESYLYDDDNVPFAKARSNWIRVWKNYWWARGVPDHVAYEGALDAVDYQIGFGALPNHHCLLNSLSVRYPVNAYDDSMVDRYRDPTTGSFSYNMGREFYVFKSLNAGDEIFLNYGYCDRESYMPSWTANIYMPEDFDAAASLVKAHQRRADKSFVYDASGRLQVVDESKITPLVKELLPQTQRRFDELVDEEVDRSELTQRIAHNSLNKRSPDWIRRHGMCMESIVPKSSTIPHAGQGAFANFNLVKGEFISPAPLMQIVNKSALFKYSADGTRNGTQLLMNYCFGHKESTLLLCPNTNALLINHCSVRTNDCGPNGPNARYLWSYGWDPASDQWRQMTLERLSQQSGRGLAFEIVATRNIRKGEEIFFDYGPEWERAWHDHVATWQPPPRDELFITVKEANERQEPIFDSLVSGDLRKSVDNSPHMFTACVYEATRDDDHEVYHQDTDWKQLSDEEIMAEYASDGSQFRYPSNFGNPGDYRKHGDKLHWPCSVIRRHARNNSTYVVRIHQSPYTRRTGEMPWFRHKLPRILYNYPRESI